MIKLANKELLFLSDELHEYESSAATPERIIYQQFLSQLHLPCPQWEYDKDRPGQLLVRLNEEIEVMDTILFDQLDYQSILSPMRLLTFYMLGELFGIPFDYAGLGLLRGRKYQFVFFIRDFDLNGNRDYALNDLSRFVLKKGKKAAIRTTIDSFFILLDEKFKERLLSALVLYQAETGIQIDKQLYIEKVMDPNRLKSLKQFVLAQI